MSLLDLQLQNVRCFSTAGLQFAPGHNLIWGPNGSGKTSLLEAIFMLGRGRSFRSRLSERLIRYGQSQLTVFGRTDDVPPRSVGVEVTRAAGTAARINGAHAPTLTALSQAFAVQVIDPGIHKLVEEGAHRRRRWLDWMVFHVEPLFAEHWTRYNRALRQRNAALKSDLSQASTWDPEIARLGELISEARRRTVERLLPYWSSTIARLGRLEVTLHYHRGWSQDVSLAAALNESRSRDRIRGMTHPGPHRGDIAVRLAGRLARDCLSRGQQKLVAIAMILAQVRLLQEAVDLFPSLLLDDPAAELDATYLREFIGEVQQLGCQLILTALTPTSDPFGTPERVFHVEQGEVRPV